MDRLRVVLEEVAEIVKTAVNGEPRTCVEEILDEHLLAEESLFSFTPKRAPTAAIPTFVLNDLASRTNNVVDYPFIMTRVWEVLIDYQHDPMLMKKALNLLLFLLINGSIQVLKDCQDPPRSSFLRELAEDYNRYEFEQYRFSTNLDVGAGVRKLAADISNFLSDERELFRARRQAEKLHQSLSGRGLRVSYPSPKSDSPARTNSNGTSFRDDARPLGFVGARSYSRWDADDLASRIVTHVSFPLAATPREMRKQYESETDDASDRSDSSDSSDEESTRPASSKSKSTSSQQPAATRDLIDLSVDLIELDTVALPANSGTPLLSGGRSPDRRTSAMHSHKLVATI
jgi:hypothetical protein